MIAVVAGVTGLVGSVLLQRLMNDPQYSEVIAVTRRPLGVSENKLKEIVVKDFSELGSFTDELKGNVYFCCLGTTIKTAGSQNNFRKVDYDAVMSFGKMAKFHHAESFILVSAMGANPHSRIFYNRVKGEVEESLRGLGLKRLVVMHPSLLMGERKEFRLGEKIAVKLLGALSPVLPTPIKKRTMTEVEALVDRMVEESKLKKSGLSVIPAKNI